MKNIKLLLFLMSININNNCTSTDSTDSIGSPNKNKNKNENQGSSNNQENDSASDSINVNSSDNLTLISEDSPKNDLYKKIEGAIKKFSSDFEESINLIQHEKEILEKKEGETTGRIVQTTNSNISRINQIIEKLINGQEEYFKDTKNLLDEIEETLERKKNYTTLDKIKEGLWTKYISYEEKYENVEHNVFELLNNGFIKSCFKTKKQKLEKTIKGHYDDKDKKIQPHLITPLLNLDKIKKTSQNFSNEYDFENNTHQKDILFNPIQIEKHNPNLNPNPNPNPNLNQSKAEKKTTFIFFIKNDNQVNQNYFKDLLIAGSSIAIISVFCYVIYQILNNQYDTEKIYLI